ncbi:uncharacterized protein HMPREF1541_05324 [Cyphellophora europaea CBS 101466]|uniref:Carboxypeptidase n=1 Tax=Cyphellophora europaea (strain CBS 101466) TaxID=1220924 RepID=W2RRL0_CYPE1|nr:uncharacterized protein HMPREF1541_05324 [Cyphellophora europaea CBS 101466]ETN39102.1 hypothetical protein HMPREF1541_05324 [Cyphellophora europaea CBS 101466]
MKLSSLLHGILQVLCLSQPALAGFPTSPEGVTVLESRFGDNVTISYKETYICETTPGVRAFAGYVHLPPGSLDDLGEEQSYPINTFFWFFEARKNASTAPLSIWMNGGPGSSSMLGLLVENGPCYVNPDSNSTRLSEWSWNNEVNMLFLDQPVQVGFSYDVLTNITTNLVSGDITLLNDTDPLPDQNATFLTGTYPSQDGNSTALGSRNAAIALWHFAQTWFQEFPFYRPTDQKISLATESYGGRYGPAFFAFFEEQNQKIANGSFTDDDGEMFILNLDTLLIINGCIDRQVMYPSYPHIAYNNTYGIQTVNETIYQQMLDAYYGPGGCRDQIDACRAQAALSDPDDTGSNSTLNALCASAENFCSSRVRGPYLDVSGRNYYDFATLDPDPLPPPFYEGYLNQPHVQAALGTPLNWTQSSSPVGAAFRSIGDYVRPGWLEDLAYLLDNGIKVTLMYGDRDYACNWIGGEAVSLAIPHASAAEFASAGYAPLMANDSYEGGMVRQHGNLSFARVYEAGHEVPFYQPETAYRVFTRSLFNVDVATGETSTVDGEYSSIGPEDSWGHRNESPEQPLQYCYVLDPGATCTPEQVEGVENGTAVVRSWIVVDGNSSVLFPDVVGDGGAGGSRLF